MERKGNSGACVMVGRRRGIGNADGAARRCFAKTRRTGGARGGRRQEEEYGHRVERVGVR